MVTILIRTLLIYAGLMLTMRLMGKRQIGELEVTDLVTTLLLSEIASLPITNQEIPLAYAGIPMVTLLSLEVFSSYILLRIPWLKSLLASSPTVLIHRGQLQRDALKQARFSLDELMTEIRGAGLSGLDQVDYAILEKSGKLTVLPKGRYAPPTVEQLGLTPDSGGLQHILYNNGRYSKEGLRLIGRDRAWLEKQLQRRGLKAESLFCVTGNDAGQIYWIQQPGGETMS